MGNASSIREEDGEWGQQRHMGEVQEDDYDGLRDSHDLMRQSPPRSPRRRVTESPLLFTPQTPVEPLQRPDDVNIQSESRIQSLPEYEDSPHKQRIPTMITWSNGGSKVKVEGSWDDWKSREPLQRSGKDFTIIKVLLPGFYQFRFIVDGEWRYSPDFPWILDETGTAYNILDLKDYVPDAVESIACFEPPQSPVASYDNSSPTSEDFAKEPPMAPSHLNLTLLNTASGPNNLASLPRPQHVGLNHLYIQKPKNGQPFVVLGETRRFQAKYVSVVLFKSMKE